MHKIIVLLKILLSFTFTWKIAFHVACVTSGFVCAWLFLSALSDKRRSLEWKLLPSASPGTPVIAVTHTNQPVPIPYRPEYFFLSGLILTTARVVFITIKIAFIFTSLSAVHIYDFHIFTVIYSKEYCLCIENNSGTEYDSDLRSNEHYFNSSEKKAWKKKKKKFRPVRDLNPWPWRYRCNFFQAFFSLLVK